MRFSNVLHAAALVALAALSAQAQTQAERRKNAALIEALQNRRIAGAGLDVFEHEPDVPSALSRLDNALLLPHLGSATQETRVAMGMRVIDNALAYFRGETPPDRVV